MKIRTGFVSNSSSSSFCIFGIYADGSGDATREQYDEAGFSTYNPYDDGSFYAGVDFTEMGLDETKRQFQDRVEAKFKAAGFDDNLSWLEEGWYSG